MAQTPIGPGTLLAGRFVLVDLLDETEGARFWRAQDTVLARDVAVHVVASDDPRSAALLSAARTSATVSDGHLLRVLDAATEDGVTYVVNEWGSGISLDKLLLSEGPLSPRRAAWVVKEVAEAVATAHRQGIAHGRLLPENVVVSDSGSVKLIGFVVDAVLRGREQRQATGGPPLGEHEADVMNLAALLYAGLVARWPGTAGTKVPAAPTEHGRTLRPRQVRAGVPRPLDAICERVLNPDPNRHVMSIETAHEIYAALSDYIGDPAAAAPIGLDATAAMSASDLEMLHGGAPLHRAGRGVAAAAPADPDATQAAPDPRTSPHPEATRAAPAAPAGHPGPGDPEATQAGAPAFFDERADDRDGDDPEATQVHLRPAESAGSADSADRVAAPPPPPPVLPEPAARPLFASDRPRTPRPGESPSGSTFGGTAFGSPGVTRSRGDLPPVWGPDADLPPEDPDDGDSWSEENAGRSWLRLAVAIGGVMALVVALVLAFTLGRGSSPAQEAGSGSSASSTVPSKQPAPVKIAAVSDFDPQGDPPAENSQLAPLAADGDPQTAWRTSTYYDPINLLKDGVGLLVDLGEAKKVSEVDVTFIGTPTTVELLAAESGAGEPSSTDQLTSVASVRDAGVRAQLRPARPVTTQYLVVWLTDLPAVGSGFRGEVAEINVRS
ncbi:protein kinase family protein [Nocardioides mesophilus]|uniref:non-specific serine/threonine protein kinase n=1 Tax=Nocardioides mesophilus TaxID=433659 RepID=A0A7G9RFQ7_9ACTN|nr:protein kinase family protein [Nocardioides mesophilus]QNN54432.1 protein kinase family protein [Nocardioides mesophilus]